MTVSPNRLQDLPAETRATHLSTPLISDCIESLGHEPMALAPGLRPMHRDPYRVLLGPAYTCLMRRTGERVEIDRLLETVDATPAGAIVMVAVDQDIQGALWGGLLSTRVSSRGGAAVVVDGGVRDLAQIAELDFPVFAAYTSPLDIRGRAEVIAHGVPVDCRGVHVAPGDTVVADADGIVVVPIGIEAEVVAALLARIDAEVRTEEALRSGRSAKETYREFNAF